MQLIQIDHHQFDDTHQLSVYLVLGTTIHYTLYSI